MPFSSRAYHASTKVTTNQTASSTAVMTRFLRQYSWCLCTQLHEHLPWLADAAVPRKRRDGLFFFFPVYAR